MKTFTTMLMLVVATVAQAAAPSYHRLWNFPSGPVNVSANCNVDGTGSFSFSVNGTMQDSNNPVTLSGTVVIAANTRPKPGEDPTYIVKSFAGQWVETSSSGNVTGTFSVKNFADFSGQHGCFSYPTPSKPDQTGYHVLSTVIATFKATNEQGKKINGEINLGVQECNWGNTDGLICNFDDFFATWDSDGF